MLRDEPSDFCGVRQIDEVSPVGNDLLGLNTAARDHVVAPAVNLMHRTVKPRRLPPAQDHGGLPSELHDRHVLAHVEDQPMVVATNSFRSSNHPARRPGETTDNHIGHQPGGLEDQPVSLGNSRRTSTTGDEDHAFAVAPRSHLASQHASERDPAENAGTPTEPQSEHHPGRVRRQILALSRDGQFWRLEADTKGGLGREKTSIASHARKQDEPLRRHDNY